MNWTRRTAMALIAAMAFGAGFMTGTTEAAPPLPEFVAPPEAATFDNVIDAAEMEDLVAITERIDARLTVGADGLVYLDESVTAEELGVTETFLANYREALAESNKLIERGELVVDADLQVAATDKMFDRFSLNPAPGVGPVTESEPSLDTVGAEPVPDWSAWNYGSGAMYYNSYNTYSRYRNSYYGLCNSMAAYIGCSRCAPSLQYFYSYNSSYMSNYCYQSYGLYYYLPYNTSGCGGYNPCYGSLSYKPAYYWTQARSYNYNCRCYQYQWQWQGYWSRY